MAADGNRAFQEVIDRIKAARGLQTNREVAELLGLTASNLGERKSRGALPRAEIDELCKAARLNPEWLYEGRGEMLAGPVGAELRRQTTAVKAAVELTAQLPLPDTQRARLSGVVSAVSTRNIEALKDTLRGLDLVLVPRMHVRASAGDGSFTDVTDEQVVDVMGFSPKWLADLGVKPGSLAVISVKGDSMADTLHDGDLILVDTSLVERKAPGVYVIVKSDTLLVKRLNFKMNGCVEIISDNRAYGSETLSASEFEHLHLVGRMVRRVVR